MVYTGWLGNTRFTQIGTGTMYIGGVPANVSTPDYLPLRTSLEVDFETFLVNLM